MKLNIKSSQVELDKAIETHIKRKLKLALSRVEPFITTISLNLSDHIKEPDINGNTGLTVMRCCLHVTISKLPVIEVEDTHPDIYYAIDRVIQKASRIISRKLVTSGIEVAK